MQEPPWVSERQLFGIQQVADKIQFHHGEKSVSVPLMGRKSVVSHHEVADLRCRSRPLETQGRWSRRKDVKLFPFISWQDGK